MRWSLLPGRPDGTLARGVPAYRRFMPALMPTRNASAVLFEQDVRVEPALAWCDTVRREHPDLDPSPFHVVLWAMARVLEDRPRLNRFVAGGRLYDRDGIWFSYSVKRALSDDAVIEVVKRRFDPSEGFVDLVRAVDGGVDQVRRQVTTLEDREAALLVHLPVPLRRLAVRLANGLDDWNLLPAAWIRSDAFFASAFVANLGSLHLDSAFHHLYEYGNIPIFVTVGEIHDAAVAEHGDVTARRVVTLRFTYDERIEDGLYAQRALKELCALVEHPTPSFSTQ